MKLLGGKDRAANYAFAEDFSITERSITNKAHLLLAELNHY